VTEGASDDLERARRGDQAAFGALAGTHERALYAHVARVLGPGPDAEDVVQDAFVSAWRSLAGFQGTSFRAWLFRIGHNRAIDIVRARRRRGELPLEPAEEDEVGWAEPADPGPEPAGIAGDREALTIVEAALAGLPPEQRAALVLRDVEGFDYDEIARIMACELGTVKSRIHRARVAVRNALVARGWRGSAG
jgi:RNA polymerase sigma-70 factor (ECF subfamily)